MRCGFPSYTNKEERCGNYEDDVLEVDIEGKVIKIPICSHHIYTWRLMIGLKGLAELIRDNKVWRVDNV